jgi:hypothetical protein
MHGANPTQSVTFGKKSMVKNYNNHIAVCLLSEYTAIKL